MKERLLFVMLALAAFMLWMYWQLCQKDPGLLSGFIVLIGVGISHILNSAEDILNSLFHVGEVPKPEASLKPLTIKPQASPVPAIVPIGLLCLGLIFMCGCASYNEKAVCMQLGTTGASIPYVGGSTNGSGYMCYLSCIGPKCPTPDTNAITALMKTEAVASNNSIITSGPVKVSVIPVK